MWLPVMDILECVYFDMFLSIEYSMSAMIQQVNHVALTRIYWDVVYHMFLSISVAKIDSRDASTSKKKEGDIFDVGCQCSILIFQMPNQLSR